MKIVAIVQARMTSTRLPGKVLMDLAGLPMLARVVDRAAAADALAAVWVATTDRPTDDPIETWCQTRGVSVVRGSETDVLGRFVLAADRAKADVVVRITADCPFLDPAVLNRCVRALNGADYAANVLERSYPRGLDVEVFTRECLDRMDRLGTSAAAREHVTVVARMERPDEFQTISVRADQDDSDLRWTVDTAADLDFARRAYQALGLGARVRPYEQVVRWCRANATFVRRDDEHETWDPSRPRAATRERSER